MPDIPEVPSAKECSIEYALSQEMLDAVVERWQHGGFSKPCAFRHTFTLTKTPKVPEPKMMAWPSREPRT